MIQQILQYLRNYFVMPDGIHTGKFEVQNGGIELPFLMNGQYFRIVGSVRNDGVYQYPCYDLLAESFEGAVWALAIPRGIIDLTQEIEDWQDKHRAQLESVYKSESFGGYSYTKAENTNGAAYSWQQAFFARLAPYRKPRETAYVQGRPASPDCHRPFHPDVPWKG